MALLLFFRMMMEEDFQLVGKWLKEKQAEKRVINGISLVHTSVSTKPWKCRQGQGTW